MLIFRDMVTIDAGFELEYSNENEFYQTLHRRTKPGCDAVGVYGTAIRFFCAWGCIISAATNQSDGVAEE